ncbi:50S ribosomal protein L17 [Limnochorda pilosa]|uniref:Large ribosomal subunit protein bL17 n=1 Tax=Limnochorda pilosa TaxID=1555112 RepID=A0A0K2SPL3_LIMPI|nr:50S ribosomal protein L17 [Limnochorda pilosa]BAS29060.1 50S ribosomal protein L17 [Limnochorda pilosa]
MKQHKLGRNAGSRRALLRNQVSALIVHGRIETTEAKAKAIRPLAEHMIHLGKQGTLHARRQAAAYLLGKEPVQKLFDEVAPRYQERTGGYVRIVKAGVRRGDAAPMSIIELV